MLRIWLSQSNNNDDTLLLCSKNNILHWISELEISCPNTSYEVWADNDHWKTPLQNLSESRNKIIICSVEDIHTILELEIIAIKQQSIGVDLIPTKSSRLLTQCCGILVDIRNVDHEKVKGLIEGIKVSKDSPDEHWLSSLSVALQRGLKNRCIISNTNIDMKEYCGIFALILPSISASWNNWIGSANYNLTTKKPKDIFEKLLIIHHDLDNMRYHSFSETIYKVELTPAQKYKYFAVLNYLVEHKHLTREV